MTAARTNNIQSVIVFASVSQLGFTDQTFVDPREKINDAYYHDVLLSQLFPYDNVGRILHHKAEHHAKLLKQVTLAFIPPDLLLPYCLNHNPIDDKAWSTSI